MNNEFKNVYIVLTYTGTILSKIIKGYTGASFSHVSIALDENLNEMYSFGRLNPYVAFIGGFIHEYLDKGTFKRFKGTYTEIYSLPVTIEQYNLLKEKIDKMYKNRKKYKFNTIGLFANGLKIKIQRTNHFYCAEFVKYLLDYIKADVKVPELIQPIHFKDNEAFLLEYRGLLRNYKK